jgi:phosphohistidine phosphatase
MKTLILTRHAKSDWTNPLQKDFDRTLNERGLQDAPMMGKRLYDKKIIIDLIVSSTATRAAQTAELIAQSARYDISKIQLEFKLYHASPSVIEQVIFEVDDKINTLMIVCHNPGITNFVNSFCGEIAANMPTCGMVAFAIDTDCWNKFPTAKTELLFFDFPKNKI